MRATVTAPALREARFGLVKTASKGDTGARWENGVTYNPKGCHVIFGHVPGCPGEAKSTPQQCWAVLEYDPWLLETGLIWNTADLAANPKEMIRETMEMGTSSVLERLTEVGNTGTPQGTALEANFPVAGPVQAKQIEGRVMALGEPGVGREPPTFEIIGLVDGTGYTATQAFGQLEAKMLDADDHTGGAGTILMSPVHAVDVWGLLDPSDGGLCSKITGSTVVIGNFQPGRIWGVMGDVDVYLSEIEIFEATDRATNEYALIAERYAVAVWNCAVFGATVTP